jgi:dolichyldiphosphatase
VVWPEDLCTIDLHAWRSRTPTHCTGMRLVRQLLLVAVGTFVFRAAAFVHVLPHRHHRIETARIPELGAVCSMADDAAAPTVPLPILAANGATKYVVVAAQTAAVVTRRDLASPFIVLGSIIAAFGTQVLKQLINQRRPDGSLLTDPGMPSSHALVSSFAAAAWALQLHRLGASVWLGLSAATVSSLRVVSGYHTWPQVLVGSGLGAASAACWMALGVALAPRVAPRTAYVAVYACYSIASAGFVLRKMSRWSPKY